MNSRTRFQLPQPNITHSQYGNNVMALPAVGATFETTVPHSLKQKTQSNALTTKSTNDSFNIDMYLDKDPKDKQLSKSQFAINFSACKLKDYQSTCELAKQVDEPATKRRKINILPSQVDTYFSSSSTIPSTDTKSNSLNHALTDKETNKDDKKTLGKQYLKDVSI